MTGLASFTSNTILSEGKGKWKREIIEGNDILIMELKSNLHKAHFSDCKTGKERESIKRVVMLLLQQKLCKGEDENELNFSITLF